MGQNPPTGVVVQYYFKETPEEEVMLEFRERNGNVIKTFTSKQKENIASQSILGRGDRGETVPTEAGMNRFIWNMRYPDAKSVPKAIMWSGVLSGPQAVPGEYEVLLKMGDVENSQIFTIKGDPRLETTQADYQEQFDFLMTINDKVTEVHTAINTIRDVRKQVKTMAKRANESAADIKEAAKALNEKLTAIEEELIQTKSKSRQDPLNYPIKDNNKMAALTGVVMGANARPTDQAYDVYEILASRVNKQLAKLDDVLDQDVPAFNRVVRENDIPAVSIEE